MSGIGTEIRVFCYAILTGVLIVAVYLWIRGFAQTGCSQTVADQSGGCLLLGRNFRLYFCADLSYE